MGDDAAYDYDPCQMLDLLDHELPSIAWMEYMVETMPALPD